MANRSVKVTLHVTYGVIEVRLLCLASHQREASAASGVLTAGTVNERSGAGQAVSPSNDEEAADTTCINPIALADEYTLLCAKLQEVCETLAPPVPASAKPKVAVLSDVKLKTVCSFLQVNAPELGSPCAHRRIVQIGPCIEGRREHLEAMVKFICSDVPEDKENVRIAVKNIIFQEATRKSYTSEKRAFPCWVRLAIPARTPTHTEHVSLWAVKGIRDRCLCLRSPARMACVEQWAICRAAEDSERDGGRTGCVTVAMGS